MDEIGIIKDRTSRLVGQDGAIKIVYAVRPNNILLKDIHSDSSGSATQYEVRFRSPDIEDVLLKRLSHSSTGQKIGEELWTKIGVTPQKLLDGFMDSSKQPNGAATRMIDLCLHRTTSDGISPPSAKAHDFGSINVRHFLKLFRRFVRDDALGGFDNIGNGEHLLEALMVPSGSSFEESYSFIFNLFDNENPTEIGNSLIRYRTLEFVKNFGDLTDPLDIFCAMNGFSKQSVLRIIHDFHISGLIRVSDYRPDVTMDYSNWINAEITWPGIRHLDLVTSEWYILGICTGTHLPRSLIYQGEEAKERYFASTGKRKLADFFKENGWVDEKEFVDEFLGHQISKEDQRIAKALENESDLRKKIVMNNIRNFMTNVVEEIIHARLRRVRVKNINA